MADCSGVPLRRLLLLCKRSERKSDEKGRYWTERSYGSFERTIPLPSEVNGDKAQSEFKNGVLRILARGITLEGKLSLPRRLIMHVRLVDRPLRGRC